MLCARALPTLAFTAVPLTVSLRAAAVWPCLLLQDEVQKLAKDSVQYMKEGRPLDSTGVGVHADLRT